MADSREDTDCKDIQFDIQMGLYSIRREKCMIIYITFAHHMHNMSHSHEMKPCD